VVEVRAGEATEVFKVAEVIVASGCRCLDFDRNDPTIAGLQHDVDLALVAIALFALTRSTRAPRRRRHRSLVWSRMSEFKIRSRASAIELIAPWCIPLVQVALLLILTGHRLWLVLLAAPIAVLLRGARRVATIVTPAVVIDRRLFRTVATVRSEIEAVRVKDPPINAYVRPVLITGAGNGVNIVSLSSTYTWMQHHRRNMQQLAEALPEVDVSTEAIRTIRARTLVSRYRQTRTNIRPRPQP
jgi:hypothetical protein